MPAYKKGDENKYFSSMIAAMLVITVGVIFFVYSLITESDKHLDEIFVQDVDGVTQLNPGAGMATPDSEPNLNPPTSPPIEN